MAQYSAEFPSRPVAQLLGSNGPIHAVTYSSPSTSTYILTGSSDRSIRLYNPFSTTPFPQSGSNGGGGGSGSGSGGGGGGANHHPNHPPSARLIQTYTAHSHEVLSLSVSSSNSHFASAGGDRTVHLWDVAAGKPSTPLRRFGSASTAHSHTGRVNCVTFAGSDDSLLISGGLDCTVRIWDTKSSLGGGGKPIQVLGEARDSVTSIVVPSAGAGAGAGAEIITASVDGRVRTYDVRMGRCVTDVLPAAVTSLCLSGDAKTLLVGTLDSRLRLMDRRDGQCLKTYGGGGGGSDDREEADQRGGGWRWKNTELRVQSCLGGKEKWVVAGDELTGGGGDGSSGGGAGTEGRGNDVQEKMMMTTATTTTTTSSNNNNNNTTNNNQGRVWAWDLMTGRLVAKVPVPWGPDDSRRRVIGRDGKEKERKNVISCIAWQDGGFGNQFCVGGTSGVATVFGEP